jgi:DNA-binding GntR family transcriptional regulator
VRARTLSSADAEDWPEPRPVPLRVAGGVVGGEAGIVPTLLADQVYDALANQIFTGERAAGTRLRVREVAEQFGTSVMPVREAVGRLVRTGLAVSHPHRGARVREFTTRELLHIYEVRAILEVEATRQGTAAVTHEDLEQMRAACHRMYQAVVEQRINDALDEDEALLSLLYRRGGNQVLFDTITTLWSQCRAYKVIGARAALLQHDNSLWRPQALLIEACAARDTAAAVRITQKSVDSARRRLETEIA